jgi:hemerythrin-like domain-containing protein
MRIARKLNDDQETISRFITVLGSAMTELSSNKLARPEFFVQAYSFISEYIEAGFFKKEELLMNALEDVGFPADDGPIQSIKSDQKKSHEAAAQMLTAAKQWQAGDNNARVNVSWATSEYTSTFRQHLARLKNLIFPLLEQNLAIEEEHQISKKIDAVSVDGNAQKDSEKYQQLIETLEGELSDWR